MDQIVSSSSEEVDIEDGNLVLTERLSFDDNNLINPLIGEEEEDEEEEEEEKQRRRRKERRNSQSLDLSDKKFDNNKFNKKTIRKSQKPPRPPRGPLLNANDHKIMKEIAELAMRKRARIERMRRIKALKSSSSSNPCSSVFAMIVTVLFFVFLIFQGFFTSNASLTSQVSPAPTDSSTNNYNRMVTVQFFNEFAPRKRIDPSTTTSFRYTRKKVSGADNEENTRELTR